MTTEYDNGNKVQNPQKLCFILAIAGRLDAISEHTKPPREKISEFAVFADSTKVAYYPFAILDGLNLSYSMFKYFFDAVIADKSLNLHDTMLTPEGIASIAAESIFIIGFSFLAAHFEKIDGEYSNAIKEFIVTAWPYARDVMKALKNSYKGLRSTFYIANTLSKQSLLGLMVPATLIFSLVAAANRLWLRDMFTKRSKSNANNKKLLKEILNLTQLSEQERLEKLQKIGSQSRHVRRVAYAAVGFNAVADSMYYYIGMLGLASLSTALIWPLLAISIFYCISCVATRLFEEYSYQQKLIKTQVDCEINLIAKRLETIYGQILLNPADRQSLDDFQKLLKEFEKKRNELIKLSQSSYKAAFLNGLNQGLYAYGTLTCGLFIACLILALCQVAFPPAILVSFIVFGLVLVALSVSKSLIENYAHNYKQSLAIATNDGDVALKDLEKDLKNNLISEDEFKQALKNGLAVNPAPKSNLVSWYEIFRSFFSGIGKGQKITDFTLNPFMEAGNDGDYHETTAIYALMAVASLIFSITRAVRALAKGIGRPLQEKKAAQEKNNHGFVELPKVEETTMTHQEKKTKPHKTNSTDSISSSIHSSNRFFNNNPIRNKTNPIRYNDGAQQQTKDTFRLSTGSI